MVTGIVVQHDGRHGHVAIALGVECVLEPARVRCHYQHLQAWQRDARHSQKSQSYNMRAKQKEHVPLETFFVASPTLTEHV